MRNLDSPPVVGVTSRSFSAHPVLRAELEARYPGAKFNNRGVSLRGNTLLEFLGGCTHAIVAIEPIDASLLAQLPELDVISKYGVGVDMLDFSALRANEVLLGWSGGVNRHSVAELTICITIAALRKVTQARDQALAGRWKQLRGRLLRERIVGIVGLGNIGTDVARLARAFSCCVIANDIMPRSATCAELGVRQVSLNELLERSDVVTLHVPLYDATRGLIKAPEIARMRNSAVLINTARAGIVDEPALLDALDNDVIAAAAFDVFDNEPKINETLFAHPKMTGTTHLGGSSEEAVLAMGRAAIDGLENPREARMRNFFDWWKGDD